MNGQPLRVLVAAASPVVRAGLEALLAAAESMTVVGSAGDRASLAQQLEDLEPDVVLLELEPPGEEGAPPALPALAPPRGPALVVLSDDDGPASAGWAAGALRAGARAVLPRGATAAEVVAAVEAAGAGLVALHPDVADALLGAAPLPAAREGAGGGVAAPASPLTPREVEVLGMLAEGLGNKQIAARLGISEHTVKFHVTSILNRLGAASRAEAVAVGIRRGLILL